MREISAHKSEPEWMTEFRLKATSTSVAADAELGRRRRPIDFDNIYYYLKPVEEQAKSWDDLPAGMKETWDKLGIPEAEKKYLAGVGAQYESEVVYHSLQEDLAKQGVIFLDMDSALREHADLVRQYFGTIIPYNDNKFAALNSAVWSGGSFIYVPPGRQGRAAAAGLLPDQRREHGPVRADADHRRQGCLRALRRGLHGADLLDRLAALGRGRDPRRRGRPLPLHDDPELVDQRLQPGHQAGGRRAQRHHGVGRRQPRVADHDEVPGGDPEGRGAHGEVLSIAFAGKGQHQDAGGKITHAAPNTTLGDHLQVDLQGRRPQLRTAGCCR